MKVFYLDDKGQECISFGRIRSLYSLRTNGGLHDLYKSPRYRNLTHRELSCSRTGHSRRPRVYRLVWVTVDVPEGCGGRVTLRQVERIRTQCHICLPYRRGRRRSVSDGLEVGAIVCRGQSHLFVFYVS